MTLLNVRYPVEVVSDPEGEEYFLALMVGKPQVAFGDEVSLGTARMSRLYVAGVDYLPANEIVPEVLHLLGALSTDVLVASLSRLHRTAYPLDVPVTLYTLYEHPVEATPETTVEDAGEGWSFGSWGLLP